MNCSVVCVGGGGEGKAVMGTLKDLFSEPTEWIKNHH